MEHYDLSGIDAITHGDERQARQLRATLAVIARRTTDPSLRRLAVAVLDGRESVRRVFAHPSFEQMATASLRNLEEGLDRLDDEQRAELLSRVGRERTDDEEIEALRATEPSTAGDPDDQRGPTRRDAGRWG